MVITIVIDSFGDKNNGTTVTAMRMAELMVNKGNEVRIIAYVPKNADFESLKIFKILECDKVIIPVFDFLITGNGYTFADCDEKKIAEFIKGSDVVHIMVPFALEAKVRRVAKIMSIPVTSAYHLQPDSISYNIHLGHIQIVNSFIYYLLNHFAYLYTRTIHTPSETMRDLMIAHGYHGDIHAISNGVSPYFIPMDVKKPEEFKDKFVILMIGRLSGEKRQDLIIKAIGHSKYNEKIQLILCGQGPKRKHYEKMSKRYLANPPIFKFCSQKELRNVINYTDLYIHASDIESEAIACVEAFSCGKVPIISDSKYSATNHFALDEKCLFRKGKPLDLRDKIEYFIEHPEEKEALSKRYIEYSKTFEIGSKVDQLLDMMRLEIERDQEDHRLNRTYYSTVAERYHLRRTAKKIGLENPYIVKKDVFHDKTLKHQFDNKEEKKLYRDKK